MWPFRRKKRDVEPTVMMTISGDRYGPEARAQYGARINGPNARIIRKHLERTNELQEAPASKHSELAQRMLRGSDKVAKAFRDDGWKEMPTHMGFRRIAINLERQGDLEGAIATCQAARRQGWSGDWDKRIERCQGKMAKKPTT